MGSTVELHDGERGEDVPEHLEISSSDLHLECIGLGSLAWFTEPFGYVARSQSKSYSCSQFGSF